MAQTVAEKCFILFYSPRKGYTFVIRLKFDVQIQIAVARGSMEMQAGTSGDFYVRQNKGELFTANLRPLKLSFKSLWPLVVAIQEQLVHSGSHFKIPQRPGVEVGLQLGMQRFKIEIGPVADKRKIIECKE